MAIPSRKQQIEAVAKFLDSDRNEGRSLEEIAAEIVDGYHDLLTKDLKTPHIDLRDGMLIKTAITNKVYRVYLLDDGQIWILGDTGGYGWLGPSDTHFWDGVEEYRPKKRIDGKMIEMTPEMIAEAWSNPDYRVGDQVSQRQRQHLYEIIATGPGSVLLRNLKSGKLTADSNSNLAQYYRREVKGATEW